jgi:hypothetical protein
VPTYTSIESRLLHKICEARLPLEHGLPRLFAGLISCAPANPEFATRKGANHRAVTAIVISLSLSVSRTEVHDSRNFNRHRRIPWLEIWNFTINRVLRRWTAKETLVEEAGYGVCNIYGPLVRPRLCNKYPPLVRPRRFFRI